MRSPMSIAPVYTSILVTAGAAAAAGGCAHKSSAEMPPRAVTVAEFARPPTERTAVDDEMVLAGALQDDGGDELDGPTVWFEELELDERTVLQPTKPGESVIVDSLVGHVNGRPIFADEFLEPIEDRLLRASEETIGIQREQVFMMIINDWLREVVLNELILAVAQASLTEQQQMG